LQVARGGKPKGPRERDFIHFASLKKPKPQITQISADLLSRKFNLRNLRFLSLNNGNSRVQLILREAGNSP
jgi:hypothetical protein